MRSAAAALGFWLVALPASRAQAGRETGLARVCATPGALGRPAVPSAQPTPVAAPTPTAAPAPGTVAVDLTLRQADGKVAPASDAAVWLEGAEATAPGLSKPAHPRIAQRHKRFEPHVEVVPVGTTVAFPNFDHVYHNVFSLSEIATFDLGLYRNGASRSVTFTKPGVVRIYCNIHPHMSAFLVVVPSDLVATTGANGRARIAHVPPGRYHLKIWHETAGTADFLVTVTSGRTAETRTQLDASHFRFLPHKNKYGKDYPPPDDDEDRY
jgi:plastocyanin